VVSTLPDDVLLNVKEPNLAARLATGDPTAEPAAPFGEASVCHRAEQAIYREKREKCEGNQFNN
jgi:hypothetical protein